MRFWVRSRTRVLSSLGFSRIDKRKPDNVRRHCSASCAPASPNNSFPRQSELLNRKENSPQVFCRCFRVHLRYRANSAAWYGNINPFPFRWIAPVKCFSHGITQSLRIDSPMSNRCSHGTLLHSSPQGSRLNLCYFHQDLHSSPFHLSLRSRLLHKPDALLLAETYALFRRQCIGHALERHPFSGLMHSAGELLHTP